MIVRSGRRGGYTTQMFLDILASDKNAIVRCRDPHVAMLHFIEMFHRLVRLDYKNEIKLIDGRVIRFVNMSVTEKVIGFDGLVKTDI